ncbi:retrovirus-related pol polyprotein from transposon TNT 1-94 [Tanacetum coccineum]|uniref:Retrovirus-related pol polyprotein from transposon TNT 1-94 n=1 Tax=Tanacetum coccineum TaxID=301880 RepID=A0ABQ5AH53_9ASTR
MDSIIPLGQKNTLAEYMILSSADNRPPMLDKDLYDSWKSRIELYMQNREHGRMILESVENGPLIWRTVEENGVTKIKKLINCFVVSVFSPGDDPIVCLNKAMAFLTAVASSRFPSTNNQLRTSSNLRNQTTIQDGRVTVQQVHGRQGQSYSGTGYKSNATSSGGNNASGQARVVKCYNCQGEGHMARQCTQPKRSRNASWYKEKAMLAKAQEAGQILDEEQLAFLADLEVPDGQVIQTIISNNAAFQTEDLDTYDSDCGDILNAQAVLMANISNYGSDVILEVPHSETYLNDMVNQGYQNPFHLKNAQRIKSTLYDGIVMSDKHVVMPVIDDEETEGDLTIK